ncbi:MAG: hypothetical protein KC478_06395 [Bacteriovoracaceae bacterium]|nr:hypothetical protein [Bacteriovoracaceae bacterium]
MLKFILLFISIPSFAMDLDLDPNKWSVCSITVNSDEELHSFKTKLSEGKNKNKFQFIELTDFSKSDNKTHSDWFDRACQSQIKCDILLISGHFGGSFFGESDFKLDLNTLEKHSCSRTCDGVLSNPMEVFLFGCNTLAGKKEDTRTAEEYIEVLVEDGILRSQAEQIAGARYSSIGDSFREKNSKIFANVPHVYGFKSIAPLGKNVKHMVDAYLARVDDYSNYLAAEHLKLASIYKDYALKGEVPESKEKVIKGNKELYQALKVTHFTQLAHQSVRCGDKFIDTNDEYARMSCLIQNEDLSVADRLELVEEQLNSDRPLMYIPSISNFLDTIDSFNSEEQEIINKISSNVELKSKLTSALNELLETSPRYSLQLANSLNKLNLLSDKELIDKVTGVVATIYKQRVSVEDKDYICSLPDTYKKILSTNLKFSDVSPVNLSSEVAISSIICINPKDTDFDRAFKKVFTGELKIDNFWDATRIMDAKRIARTQGYEDILNTALNDNDPSKRSRAVYFMSFMQSSDEKDHEALIKIASKPEEELDTQQNALMAIRGAITPAIASALAKITTNNPSYLVKAEAMRSLGFSSLSGSLPKAALIKMAESVRDTTGDFYTETYKSNLMNSAIREFSKYDSLPIEVIDILKSRKLKEGDDDAYIAKELEKLIYD